MTSIVSTNSSTNSTSTKSSVAKAGSRKKKAPATGALAQKISVIDSATVEWRPSGKEGLLLKTVREDPANGLFLGLVSFEPNVGTGLHQHQGVATAYFASGGLTDYHGSTRQHDVGINLKGATHDAVAYQATLLVSRLEGRVTYPEKSGELTRIHSGAFHGRVENENPDAPPDIYFQADSMPAFDAGVGGVTRRTLFDYAGLGNQHRMLLWTMRPNTRIPAFRTSALLEMWVYGGDVKVNGQAAHSNCFVVVEPDQEVTITSSFGARVFAWSDGQPESFEFQASDKFFGY